MSDWRKEWRNSAIYEHIGDCVDEWARKSGPEENDAQNETKYWEPVIQAIEAAMEIVEQESIAAEREACAKIADDMAANLELAGQVNPSNHINKAQLAAKELSHRIRARGEKT